MKTYIEFRNTLLLDTTYIPKDSTNVMYVEALKEVESGLAVIKPFNIPPTWEKIRALRDQLLLQSDWTVFPDAQPKPNKEAWLNYRQTLRDIPKKYTSPQAVIWPQKPS